MNALDITLPLGLGVVSSLHCAQMCGPIVLSYSMAGRGSAAGHLCYNAGRIATYALLGGIAGSLGGAVGLLGIEQGASILAGCLMLLAAVFLSGVVPSQTLVHVDRMGLSRFFSKTVGKLMLSPSPSNKLLLGAIFGFLPCGLVYAALLKAVATGSAAGGALSMMAFGVGTAGTLLGIGFFSSVISLRLRRWSSPLTTASVAAMGLFLLWRGLMVKAPAMSCHHAGL
jgi:sulfite exporter TauE/SafE